MPLVDSIEAKTDCHCPKSVDDVMCTHFVHAFAMIGKKWNGLIISSLCDRKAMRFKDLSNCIHQCSDRVLVERLRELAELGIVDRLVDPQTHIISYTLTEKGAELKPVFDQVHDWADKWSS